MERLTHMQTHMDREADMDRLEAFEAMLAAIQKSHEDTAAKMAQLKAQGREKSATYRQLMANKMTYKQMLSLYALYGLTDEAK